MKHITLQYTTQYIIIHYDILLFNKKISQSQDSSTMEGRKLITGSYLLSTYAEFRQCSTRLGQLHRHITIFVQLRQCYQC